jgi:hypothetical protein
MRLDMRSRKAIVGNTHKEYQQADKKGRGEILDRLVSITGMNWDYLATVLGRYGKDGTVEGSKAMAGDTHESWVYPLSDTEEEVGLRGMFYVNNRWLGGMLTNWKITPWPWLIVKPPCPWTLATNPLKSFAN